MHNLNTPGDIIRSGRIPLQKKQRRTHYEGVYVFLIFPIVFIVLMIVNLFFDIGFQYHPYFFTIVFAVPLVLAFLIYRLQYRRLNLKSHFVKLDGDQIRTKLEAYFVGDDWEITHQEKSYIIAKAHPSLLSGSWGEQVSVLWNSGQVYLNSIPDPDKRGSLTSLGRNTGHVRAILKMLKEHENNV